MDSFTAILAQDAQTAKHSSGFTSSFPVCEISPFAKDINLVLSSDSIRSTVSLNQINNLPNTSQFFLNDDLIRSEWMAALVGPPRFDELANTSPKDIFIKAI